MQVEERETTKKMANEKQRKTSKARNWRASELTGSMYQSPLPGYP